MTDHIYDLDPLRALVDTLDATAATADDAALGLVARTYLRMLISVLRMDQVIDRGVIHDVERERLLSAFAHAPDGLTYDDLYPMKPDWSVMRSLWDAKAIVGNSTDFGRCTRFKLPPAGRRALSTPAPARGETSGTEGGLG